MMPRKRFAQKAWPLQVKGRRVMYVAAADIVSLELGREPGSYQIPLLWHGSEGRSPHVENVLLLGGLVFDVVHGRLRHLYEGIAAAVVAWEARDENS
jgi:hypothetical protein